MIFIGRGGIDEDEQEGQEEQELLFFFSLNNYNLSG